MRFTEVVRTRATFVTPSVVQIEITNVELKKLALAEHEFVYARRMLLPARDEGRTGKLCHKKNQFIGSP